MRNVSVTLIKNTSKTKPMTKGSLWTSRCPVAPADSIEIVLSDGVGEVIEPVRRFEVCGALSQRQGVNMRIAGATAILVYENPFTYSVLQRENKRAGARSYSAQDPHSSAPLAHTNRRFRSKHFAGTTRSVGIT